MSWSRTQLIDLRNKAAGRAQQCAPIVQEAEELLTLIKLLDKALIGGPLPVATEIAGLRPLPVSVPVPKNVADNIADKHRVVRFLAEHSDTEFSVDELAQTLRIKRSTVAPALSHALRRGLIERPKRGRYCYRTRQLAA